MCMENKKTLSHWLPTDFAHQTICRRTLPSPIWILEKDIHINTAATKTTTCNGTGAGKRTWGPRDASSITSQYCFDHDPTTLRSLLGWFTKLATASTCLNIKRKRGWWVRLRGMSRWRRTPRAAGTLHRTMQIPSWLGAHQKGSILPCQVHYTVSGGCFNYQSKSPTWSAFRKYVETVFRHIFDKFQKTKTCKNMFNICWNMSKICWKCE